MNSVTTNAFLEFRPSMEVTFLPRCGNCHAPHPLARKPQCDPATCPDCGAPQGGVVTKPVEATVNIGGVSGFFADLFLKIGKALRNIAGPDQ